MGRTENSSHARLDGCGVTAAFARRRTGVCQLGDGLLTKDFDWPYFIKTAHWHRILPHCYLSLQASGADSISPLAVRSITEPGFLVGRSVHDVGEAVQYAVGVDYLIAGTVFPTTGKRDVPRLLGTSGLADITRAVRVPVLAIGGVTLQNLPQIAAAGASGIAAIGLFLDPSSIVGVVTAVRSQFDIAGAPS